MIAIPKELLDQMIDVTIAADETVLAAYETIKNFDEMIEVSVPVDHIYVPVRIFTIGGDYYLVHNNEVVWGGHIDSEGLIDTILKDLSTLSHLINFTIACRLQDRIKLAEIISSQDLMSSVISQQFLGQEYFNQNHGTAPIQ